jgi:glycosyltransferase involved in cell wall biosynthesis
MDKQEARIILGLPTEGRFLLFSAMGGIASKEKGGDLLKACLERLAVEPNGNFTLLLSGCESSPEEGELPVPFINLGRLTEEGKMKQVYAAADLTVVSSRSESLGYVAMESLACGTPCVAFDHSGNKDVVDHMQNGYLARAYDPAGLAAGIRWILEDPARYKQLAEAGRKKIENVFSLRHVTRSYLDLDAELLSRV